MNEYLAFVKQIGTTLNGENIYEFMFTTDTEVVWGDNFNIIPAGIIPNIHPDENTLSKKGRVITDIDLKLACKSTCFSMMDSIDGIISLCFTEAGIENEFRFDFGEDYDSVISKLKKHNLDLVEIEDIKFNTEQIIDDTIKQLKEDDDNFIF